MNLEWSAKVFCSEDGCDASMPVRVRAQLWDEPGTLKVSHVDFSATERWEITPNAKVYCQAHFREKESDEASE